MRYLLLLILILFLGTILQAQDNKSRYIQYTGRIFNEYLQPLPFSHIYVVNSKKGAISDKEGKFSFVVFEHDTIDFSSMGYKNSRVIIPDKLELPFYTRDVLLESDTIIIAAVEVYPWNDYEDFKQAFINLELPEDDLDRARKNIAIIKAQLILENNPSANMNFREVMREQYNKTAIKGTNPTYPIFNAFAWAKFISALKNGDFKKK